MRLSVSLFPLALAIVAPSASAQNETETVPENWDKCIQGGINVLYEELKASPAQDSRRWNMSCPRAQPACVLDLCASDPFVKEDLLKYTEVNCSSKSVKTVQDNCKQYVDLGSKDDGLNAAGRAFAPAMALSLLALAVTFLPVA